MVADIRIGYGTRDQMYSLDGASIRALEVLGVGPGEYRKRDIQRWMPNGEAMDHHDRRQAAEFRDEVLGYLHTQQLDRICLEFVGFRQ